MSMILADDI